VSFHGRPADPDEDLRLSRRAVPDPGGDAAGLRVEPLPHSTARGVAPIVLRDLPLVLLEAIVRERAHDAFGIGDPRVLLDPPTHQTLPLQLLQVPHPSLPT